MNHSSSIRKLLLDFRTLRIGVLKGFCDRDVGGDTPAANRRSYWWRWYWTECRK